MSMGIFYKHRGTTGVRHSIASLRGSNVKRQAAEASMPVTVA
ncbi:MAG: hypothetical protein ACHBN1_28600 [Heteroscytonema crispum UTEX LB 1556]